MSLSVAMYLFSSSATTAVSTGTSRGPHVSSKVPPQRSQAVPPTWITARLRTARSRATAPAFITHAYLTVSPGCPSAASESRSSPWADLRESRSAGPGQWGRGGPGLRASIGRRAQHGFPDPADGPPGHEQRDRHDGQAASIDGARMKEPRRRAVGDYPAARAGQEDGHGGRRAACHPRLIGQDPPRHLQPPPPPPPPRDARD